MFICGSPGDSVEIGTLDETGGDPLQQVGWIRAVVVGEADDIRLDLLESCVACTGEAGLGAQTHDADCGVPIGGGTCAVVVVLIDQQNAECRVRLALERLEQRVELVRSADGRDHEIEGEHRCVQNGQAIVRLFLA